MFASVMWWDERMKAARIVVLGLALGAGGLAAMLMSGGNDAPPPAPAPAPVAQLETVDVLVAKNEVSVGQALNAGDMGWQQWPSASAGTFIRKTDRPDAPS